jgi:hypothetical protein
MKRFESHCVGSYHIRKGDGFVKSAKRTGRIAKYSITLEKETGWTALDCQIRKRNRSNRTRVSIALYRQIANEMDRNIELEKETNQSGSKRK